jgi:predicted ATPase
VLELLRKYFGLADGDDAATRREKVAAMLTTLDPALQGTLPYLLGLLGIVDGSDPLAQMDPQIKKQRTLDAIKRIVVRESLKQPLVVIFEDLHWIDEQTQSLLDLLADTIVNARVLLLANYRPEYRHEWSNKSHYVQIGLKPLGRENAAELLTAMLGDAVELQPLKRLIIERTGGNPFLIEETVQTLFDEGALLRNGGVKVTRSLSQLRLPPTVQGILAARIDRLSGQQKELLQTMVVIGRESTLGLIRKMASLPDTQLERTLAELRSAEFIYEQPALADAEYIFKHALTHDVAYNSLLIERRKLLHERAGQALESMFSVQLDDHLSELAHHYTRSANVNKAVEYLGRVAQQAMQRCSYSEAIEYVSDGLIRLKALPDDAERRAYELSLQITLGASLVTTKGWAAPEVERAFSRAQALCSRMGEVPQLAPVLYGIWGFYTVRGELQKAREVGNQLLTLAEATGDPPSIVAGHYTLGTTSYWIGDLVASLMHLDELIRHYTPSQHRTMAALFGLDPGIVGVAYSSMALWLSSFPERALERMERAVRMAREAHHSESLAWTLVSKCEIA